MLTSINVNLSQPIVANAIRFWPYVADCNLRTESPCTKPGTVGKNIDLFRLILGKIIGFKNITFIESQESVLEELREKFGYNAKLFQPIINEDINASASLIYMDDDPEKIRSMDFSLPIESIRRGMVFRSVVLSNTHHGVFATVSAFDNDVLALLFLTCVCIKLIAELSRFLGCKSAGKASGLLTCFAAFFIFRFFKAVIYSNTMAKLVPKTRFHDLQELVDAIKEGKVQFIVDSDFAYFLNLNSAETIFIEPMKKVLADYPQGIQFYPTQSEVLLKTANNDKFVTIVSESTYDHLAIHRLGLCELEFVPFSKGFFLGFAFPKGSRLTRLVNWALYNEFYSVNDFEANWMRAYIAGINKCGDRYQMQRIRTKLDAIGMKEFSSALILYGICFSIIPCVSLLIELIVIKRREG